MTANFIVARKALETRKLLGMVGFRKTPGYLVRDNGLRDD